METQVVEGEVRSIRRTVSSGLFKMFAGSLPPATMRGSVSCFPLYLLQYWVLNSGLGKRFATEAYP